MKYTKKTHQAVGILRDRGQVTIPDDIRSSLYWMTPNSPLYFSVIDQTQVVIQPQGMALDWDGLWAGIDKARSIRGKGKISAAKFIEKDRQSH